MHVLTGKNLIEFGEFQLDTAKDVLRCNGEVVSLPLKAVELLGVLVEQRGDVVTKEELMSSVWAEAFVEDSVLTQNIYLLRRALESGGSKNLIKTVPRRGYLFTGEIRTVRSSEAAVIERHLLEKTSVDVEKEEGVGKSPPRSFSPLLIFSSVLILSIAIAGIYLYYRGGSQNAATVGFTPLKVRPFSTASGYKSLAVLPFSGADKRFAASFSSDLATRLGSMNKFAVTPSALLDEYAKLGTELKTDFVMQGKAEAKNGVYVANVSLAVTISGAEVWSDNFEYNNLAQLQDAVANRTAKKILSLLTSSERELVAKRLPSNLPAYEKFQTGYTLWRKRADGSAYLKRAIELDHSFAPAYAILANIKATKGVKGSQDAKEAEDILQKAFYLDENMPDAYAVQGFIQMFHHRDWKGAETSLKTALEMDPNCINAHHWLGVYYSIHRRLDEAKAEMHKALELDPTNPTLLADIGQLHYFAREEDAAMAFVRRALVLDPNHRFANQYLIQINDSQEIEDVETMKQLEKAANENALTLPYINVDPHYDSFREDARFQAILRKMNLPQ